MKKIYLLTLLLSAAMPYLFAQVPPRPVPPRLVNDYAGLFTAQQAAQLEHRLVAFNDSTSNQIVLLTLTDLGGYEAAQIAYETGEQWQVGQGKFDNGAVILIKPKIGNAYGEAFIATGYGLEGALPDATCTAIVNNEMIPHFRENDYYGGVQAALNVVLPIVAGEYSYSDYDNDAMATLIGSLVTIIAMVVIVLIIVAAHKGGKGGGAAGSGSKNGWLTALWLASMASGGSRSSGGGFGSSSSGGFGGFGGGSFGGGGGGGRW
jgi:uncharacterized protein